MFYTIFKRMAMMKCHSPQIILKQSSWSVNTLFHLPYQYIYIYKSKDLVRESLRFCHVMHSMKRIEIPLSHIRDKNKFKSEDSSFLLVQCFKTIFVTLLFNVLRLLIVSFGTTFQDFSSLTKKKKLFAFPFTIFTSTHLYTHPQHFIPSHLKYTQTKNDVIYFQSFNDTYITPTLQYHLIVTRMSRL